MEITLSTASSMQVTTPCFCAAVHTPEVMAAYQAQQALQTAL